jgi:type VI secretion system ImpA family protein
VRVEYQISDLIREIPGSENGVGEFLGLGQVYDSIKQAKREDDERLSLGVWQTDLKKADWHLVEELAANALIEKSKDIQIVGWLMEAIVNIEGFAGVPKVFDILFLFLERFLDTSYPLDENGISDKEQKQRLLDWIAEIVDQSVLSTNIFKGTSYKLSLFEYNYALDIKSLLLRSPDAEASVMRSVKKNNTIVMDEINLLLRSVAQEDVSKSLQLVSDAIDSISMNLERIDNISDEYSVVPFSKILESFDTIRRIITPFSSKTSEVQQVDVQEQEVIENDFDTENTSRELIYSKINELAEKLEIIERHSPSYFLLKIVVSWKDKNLLEVINDLKTSDTDAHKLLKLLLSA